MPLKAGSRKTGEVKNMPMKFAKSVWENHRGIIETVFWIAVFGVAYIAMQKVMHPGWTIFGI